MKKSILILTVSVFITGIIITSCNRPKKKEAEEEKNNMMKVPMDSVESNDEYMDDIKNFKEKVRDEFSENEKSIAEFKEEIKNMKKDVQGEYKKKIDELDQKNNDLKKKMEEYKAEGKENWESFKTEFTHDMDELGKALKDLTVKNVK